MAINTGGLQTHLGGFTGGQAFTQSTATAEQEVLPHSGVAYMGMGTVASSFNTNRYVLASTTGTATDDELPDGLDIWIVCTGTGHVNLDVLGGTATGGYIMKTAAQGLHLKRLGGVWALVVNRGAATIATATNS